MQGGRDFTNALVVALISIGLIIGALSISLVEFVPEEIPSATSSLIPSPIPLTATETLPPSLTLTISIESLTPSMTPSVTTTVTPPSNCLVPAGWGQITVRGSDTLESIAAVFRISADELRRANCLLSNSLIAGSKLYVPPVASSTPAACTPGASGWSKNYTVQRGENLFRIALNHYTTLELMRKVNCKSGDTIYPGDILWVPNVPATRPPGPSPLPGNTITPYPTDPLTETALPFTATFFPTNIPPPTSTSGSPISP